MLDILAKKITEILFEKGQKLLNNDTSMADKMINILSDLTSLVESYRKGREQKPIEYVTSEYEKKQLKLNGLFLNFFIFLKISNAIIYRNDEYLKQQRKEKSVDFHERPGQKLSYKEKEILEKSRDDIKALDDYIKEIDKNYIYVRKLNNGKEVRGPNVRDWALKFPDWPKNNMGHLDFSWIEDLGKIHNLKDLLVGANLYLCNLENMNLENFDLRYADLSEANLKGANLIGTRLENSFMDNTKIENIMLENSIREASNLRTATLKYLERQKIEGLPNYPKVSEELLWIERITVPQKLDISEIKSEFSDFEIINRPESSDESKIKILALGGPKDNYKGKQ